MALLVMPTRAGIAEHRVRVALNGSVFSFKFMFNRNSELWSMDIDLPDGTPLLRGVRLALGSNLTKQYADSRLPPGIFFVHDTEGNGAEAGLEDLGERVLLLYDDLEDAA